MPLAIISHVIYIFFIFIFIYTEDDFVSQNLLLSDGSGCCIIMVFSILYQVIRDRLQGGLGYFFNRVAWLKKGGVKMGAMQ